MPRLVRTPLTWLIYVQLGLYAYFLYSFGPIVGFLRDEQGTTNALASLHTAAIAAGAMAGGAIFAWFTRKFGRSTAMWGALGALAVAMLGFVVLPSAYPVTLTLAAVAAFGGMWIISCVVVTLTQMHGPAGSAAISEANALAVAAGFVGPIVVGFAVNAGWGWRTGLAVLIGLIALVALVAHRLRITSLPAAPASPSRALTPDGAAPGSHSSALASDAAWVAAGGAAPGSVSSALASDAAWVAAGGAAPGSVSSALAPDAVGTAPGMASSAAMRGMPGDGVPGGAGSATALGVVGDGTVAVVAGADAAVEVGAHEAAGRGGGAAAGSVLKGAGQGGNASAAVAKAPLPRAYWLSWMMMVATGTVEIVLSLWAAIVLREEIGLGSGAAAAAVSAILAGMFAGRAFGARLALRVGVLPVYFGALAISFAGFAIFWLAGDPLPAVAGLFVLGLGNAMHYPLAIALAIAVAPGQEDRAAGISSYGMGLSFGVGPFALGLLADEVGAHTALLLIPLFLAAAGLLALGLRGSASAPQVGDTPAEVAKQMA